MKIPKITSKNIIVVGLLYISFLIIKSRTWVGEDAFIFFKYVDNFVNGHGLVFNIGERVEGYTAPLWVFLLSLLRTLSGLELRPLAIYLGFALTLGALGYLLVRDYNNKFIFPLGLVLLISNSAFLDFSTSGFETSLTYLLLIVFAVNLKNRTLRDKPWQAGLLLSLLGLNRPESFLLFVYVFLLYLFNIKRVGITGVFKYVTPFLITVVPYQIFRMGYFASLLPNTFYAKKGGDFYFTQGLNYFMDFAQSYPFTIFILVGLTLFFVVNLFTKKFADNNANSRIHLLIMSALLAGYVLYAGGDYMHGRSLLMFFILWVVSINDLADIIINLLIERVKGTDIEKPLAYTAVLGGLFILFFILKSQVPITVQQKKQINNINDERTHFGMKFDPDTFDSYLKVPITGEFSWRDRGFYYRDIAETTDENISVNMPNIGFFGYAAGDNVNVMGAVLIDPVMARQPIENRGKIGHENLVDMAYLLSRKPTFSYTPFKYWNDSAHAKYHKSRYSGVITDDSNDSYIPVFDMSHPQFLDNYKNITGVDVKRNVDNAQYKLLNDVNKNNIHTYGLNMKEYFSFLKVHWYPYTNSFNQKLYDSKRVELFGEEEILGSYENYQKYQQQSDSERWSHITGNLDTQKFLSNLIYALK